MFHLSAICDLCTHVMRYVNALLYLIYCAASARVLVCTLLLHDSSYWNVGSTTALLLLCYSVCTLSLLHLHATLLCGRYGGGRRGRAAARKIPQQASKHKEKCMHKMYVRLFVHAFFTLLKCVVCTEYRVQMLDVHVHVVPLSWHMCAPVR